MCSYCLPNPHSFYKIHCLFPSVVQCYLVHWLNILSIAWPMMRVQHGFVFNIARNLWGLLLNKKFCIMRQNNNWSYFAFSQIRLVEGKIIPAVLLNHEAKETHPILWRFQNLTSVFIRLQGEKHCWSYFAIRRIRLLGLVKWQGRYSWISVRSSLHMT